PGNNLIGLSFLVYIFFLIFIFKIYKFLSYETPSDKNET
ncbi:unnamed protein product, partial [marine sediment metagenome]